MSNNDTVYLVVTVKVPVSRRWYPQGTSIVGHEMSLLAKGNDSIKHHLDTPEATVLAVEIESPPKGDDNG
jgi:hypothetical protein